MATVSVAIYRAALKLASTNNTENQVLSAIVYLETRRLPLYTIRSISRLRYLLRATRHAPPLMRVLVDVAAQLDLGWVRDLSKYIERCCFLSAPDALPDGSEPDAFIAHARGHRTQVKSLIPSAIPRARDYAHDGHHRL
eukprot:6631747-Pyramimonas_sp.AAC.1